jgi:hypothetical protein
MRVPPKIKVFLWQMIRDILPYGVQLAKRGGPSDVQCALHGEREDCDHIYFNCSMAKFICGHERRISCPAIETRKGPGTSSPLSMGYRGR